MRVLRIALLIFAFVGIATPALAHVDLEGLRPTAAVTTVTPSPRENAVQAALETAKATDPIDKRVLAGVHDFYAARNFDLLWLGNLDAPRQMAGLRDAMDKAADYGLDPTAYATPKLAAHYHDDPQELAQADVEFSLAAARFVTHIASGRIRPEDISPQITLQPERPDIAEALTRLSQSPDIAADLAAYEPPHPQYAALKAALAKLRADAESEQQRIVIPDGGLLKPGARDARAPLLRARLGIELAADADPEIYDTPLVERGEGLSGGKRPQHGRDRRAADDSADERAKPRGGDRLAHRQPGALALDAARPRRVPRPSERTRVHGARGAGRRRRARNTGDRGQADQPDADLLERDKPHHRQSILERARPRSFATS